MDKLMKGLETTGIGLLIVFAVLILLIFIIWAFSRMFAAFENHGKKSQAAPVSQKAPETAVAEPVVAVQPEMDDLELIAVISAAVAACEGSGKLVVRSVRRVSQWRNAARAEQVVRF